MRSADMLTYNIIHDCELRELIDDLRRAAGVLVALADGEQSYMLGVTPAVEAVREAAQTLHERGGSS
jgi:hypothetical protein